MVKFFKDVIILRKTVPLFHLHKRSDLENVYEIIEPENGIFILKCKKKNLIRGHHELVIIFNPLNKSTTYDLGEDYTLVFHSSGFNPDKSITIRNLSVAPLATLALVKW